jgi:hypothetical protein
MGRVRSSCSVVALRGRLSLATFSLSVVACGAPAPGPGETEPDQAEAPTAVGTTQQAYGELTCFTTTPDLDVVGLTSVFDIATPDANYGHPTCPNAYITHLVLDLPGFIWGGYDGPIVDGNVYPCNGMWAHQTIYVWSAPFWKVARDITVTGTAAASGGCTAPVTPRFNAQSYTGYRILSQAGYGNVLEPTDIGAAIYFLTR